jgi:hypothetical protein
MADEMQSSMEELIFLVTEAPEGGLTARALGFSIFTEADDIASLREQARDAALCHFGIIDDHLLMRFEYN